LGSTAASCAVRGHESVKRGTTAGRTRITRHSRAPGQRDLTAVGIHSIIAPPKMSSPGENSSRCRSRLDHLRKHSESRLPAAVVDTLRRWPAYVRRAEREVVTKPGVVNSGFCSPERRSTPRMPVLLRSSRAIYTVFESETTLDGRNRDPGTASKIRRLQITRWMSTFCCRHGGEEPNVRTRRARCCRKGIVAVGLLFAGGQRAHHKS